MYKHTFFPNRGVIDEEPAMKIGRITLIDLRELWESEAKDFTTWLAENLEALSDSLGLTLEFIEQEKRVEDSRFSIDIWAEDDEGGSVVIENQLERTNHTHLGQIVTYASNMEAKTVIWITRDARQEHANALNWLNEFTDKRFYLVQLSAIRIGKSDPAPQFTVVCKPAGEMKTLGRSKRVMNDVIASRRARKDRANTLVVPGQKEGFERVFLGESAWYSIRLNKKRIPQIKYIAGYQIAPISAVTHLAEVKEIIPSHEDPGKFKVIFKGPAKEIKHIPLGKGQLMMGPVYVEKEVLMQSKDLAEALASIEESGHEAA
jgi:hypothetical protein